MDAISKCLKATRVNQLVPRKEATALLGEMSNNSQYKALAQKIREGQAKLMAKNIILANFTRKMICVCYGDKKVPVTKSKLYAKKRVKPCSHCGTLKCHRTKNLSTMRESIREQIYAFKDSHKKELMELYQEKSSPKVAKQIYELTHCPLTGRKLKSGEVHVDHVYPFIKLVEDWLDESDEETNWLCYNKLWIKKNLKILQRWADFHQEHATLQLTRKEGNLSKGKKEWPRPIGRMDAKHRSP